MRVGDTASLTSLYRTTKLPIARSSIATLSTAFVYASKTMSCRMTWLGAKSAPEAMVMLMMVPVGTASRNVSSTKRRPGSLDRVMLVTCGATVTCERASVRLDVSQ